MNAMKISKATFTGLLLSITLLIGCTKTSAQKETKRYNILLIMADDMNEYGFFNTNPAVKTPNLNKFRQTALSFRNAYCPAPACSPSRTAILSGVAPYRSGKYYNGNVAWPEPLLAAQENLPEYFQRIGYNTYAKGKIFHANIPKERVEKNFKDGIGKGGFGPFPDSLHRVAGGGRFRGIQAFPDEDFPDNQNAEEIIKLLKKDHDKPFFMMYGLWRPHSPYTAPQRFFDMYDIAAIDIPAGYLKNDKDDLPPIAQAYINSEAEGFKQIAEDEMIWKKYLCGYYACYSFADWNIGRVIDALEESEYADNTIVIVTSDNGFHMGEKNRFNKNSLWELSAITPMAVRVPGTAYAGRTTEKPVNLQDLFPTFVEYCGNGQQPLKPIDGRSFKALLDNPNSNWQPPSITCFGENWVSIRDEQYRYILYPDGTEELYDHGTDIWELTNLAKEPSYDAVKQRLKTFVPSKMAPPLPGRWTTRMQGIEDSVTKMK